MLKTPTEFSEDISFSLRRFVIVILVFLSISQSILLCSANYDLGADIIDPDFRETVSGIVIIHARGSVRNITFPTIGEYLPLSYFLVDIQTTNGKQVFSANLSEQNAEIQNNRVRHFYAKWNTLFVANGEYTMSVETHYFEEFVHYNQSVFVNNPIINQILKTDLPPIIQDGIILGIISGIVFLIILVIKEKRKNLQV